MTDQITRHDPIPEGHVLVVECLDCRFAGDALSGSPAEDAILKGWNTHVERYPDHNIDAFTYVAAE